jgi:GLPGLI family protein
MDMVAGIKKLGAIIGLLVFTFTSFGQIKSGRIVFERKTNLEKKFDDERMKKWLGNNKSKIDEFELIFNDSISIFRPVESDEVDKLSWATSKSTVLQNFAQNEKLTVLDISGQKLYVKDSNAIRQWKITESKRTIGKYKCRKAVYEKDDSTRIYAWYAIEIVPSIGPEGFFGLPGAILGLATEDGGIIYFAKEIEIMEPKPEVFIIDTKKKDVYTPSELKVKLEKDFGSTPWGKRMFEELFRWL